MHLFCNYNYYYYRNTFIYLKRRQQLPTYTHTHIQRSYKSHPSGNWQCPFDQNQFGWTWRNQKRRINHTHAYRLVSTKKTFCLLSRKIIKSKKLEINHWSVYLISRVKSVIVVTTVVIVVQLIFHAPFRHGHLYGQFRHLVCSNWAKTNKQVQLLAGGTIFKKGKLSKLFIQHILFIVKQWQARYDANDEQGHDNNRTKVGILTFDYALKII